MDCPKCPPGQGKTKVNDSRTQENGKRRRRECQVCGYKFTTLEALADATHKKVIKRDGSSQLFNPDKIRTGIEKAVVKKRISAAQIEGVVDSVAGRVSASSQNTIQSKKIAQLVITELAKLDKVVCACYGANHRDSEDKGPASGIDSKQIAMDLEDNE